MADFEEVDCRGKVSFGSRHNWRGFTVLCTLYLALLGIFVTPAATMEPPGTGGSPDGGL